MVDYVWKCNFLWEEASAFISLSEGAVTLKMLRTMGLESYRLETQMCIAVIVLGYDGDSSKSRSQS